jgi:hypothetical protein
MLSKDSVVCGEATAVLVRDDETVVLAALVERVPGSVPKTFSTVAASKQPT